jgi:hypothetical protein
MRLTCLLIIAFVISAIVLPVVADTHHNLKHEKFRHGLKKENIAEEELNEDYLKARRDLNELKEVFSTKLNRMQSAHYFFRK